MIRVDQFAPEALSYCQSEDDVPADGWAVVGLERNPRGEVAVEPGFSHECCEVFENGEYRGDVRSVERVEADGSPPVELLMWAPVP
jgi:hypothetical protein